GNFTQSTRFGAIQLSTTALADGFVATYNTAGYITDVMQLSCGTGNVFQSHNSSNGSLFLAGSFKGANFEKDLIFLPELEFTNIFIAKLGGPTSVMDHARTRPIIYPNPGDGR